MITRSIKLRRIGIPHAAFFIVASLLTSGWHQVLHASDCACGKREIVVTGYRGGSILEIKLKSGTKPSGNPITVELAPEQELEISIAVSGFSEPDCGKAYIEFPSCGMEYRTHSAAGVWSGWAKGNKFEVRTVHDHSADEPHAANEPADPDAFQIRFSKEDQDTSTDPTGPGAGGGENTTTTSPPEMEYNTQTAQATTVPPGLLVAIPLGPVGLGPNGSHPFRSAGTLTVSGPVSSALAAASRIVRYSISEMSEIVPETEPETEPRKIVWDHTVSNAGIIDQKHIITPAKSFRIRGWDTLTNTAAPIDGTTGSFVEEFTAAQYDVASHSFSGNARASWRIEPVDSPEEGNGIRVLRNINGITSMETVTTGDGGSKLTVLEDNTETTYQVFPGDQPTEYSQEVTEASDGVPMSVETRSYEYMSWGYEMVKKKVDPTPSKPDDDDLTYRYGYHDTPDNPISHRRQKYSIQPDGSWTLNTYPSDANGITEVISPFCSETQFDETTSTVISAYPGSSGRYIRSSRQIPLDGSVESVVSVEEIWAVGGSTALAVLSRSETNVSDLVGDAAAGGRQVRVAYSSRMRDIAVTPNGTFTDALTSADISFSPRLKGADSWLAGRPLLSVDDSGRATLHAYSQDSQTGLVTHTVTTGLADNSAASGGVAVADGWVFLTVASASTQTITVSGPNGVLSQTHKFHTGTDFSEAYTESYLYDGVSGRLSSVSIAGQTIREYSYPSPLVMIETEAGGMWSLTESDSMGRRVRQTVNTPNGAPLTTIWTYEGPTTTITVNGQIEEITVADGLGRTVSHTDAIGAVTSTEYPSGGRVVTRTRPGGVTQTDTRHLDGRQLSHTGDGTTGQFHTYDVIVDAGLGRISETVHLATAASARWRTSIAKMDGSTHQAIRPAFGGAGTVTETHNYHPGSGRLSSIVSSAPHTPPRLFPLDASSPAQRLGTLQISGLDDGDGTLVLADDLDRVTRSSTTYELSDDELSDDAVVEVTLNESFVTPGSDTATTTSKRQILTPAVCSRTGFGSGLERSVETIQYASGSPIRTLTQTTLTFPGGMIVREDDSATTLSPDSETTYIAGSPVSRHVTDAIRDETWAYDARGRETRHTDARGGSRFTGYNGIGQVESVIDPAGKPTQYTYHPATSHAAGRVDTITDPLGNTTIHSYYDHGRIESVTGTASYPLAYTYNSFGEQDTLTTWREAGNANSAAVTTWKSDPSTGLLAAKFYQGQTEAAPAWKYTYFGDGRVQTRKSLGGRLATYAYNDFGDLLSVTYTGDNNLTPDVTYSGHDRLGRPGSVLAGGDTTTLTYDPITGAESTAYAAAHSSLPGVAVTAQPPDGTGRPTGFELKLGTTPIHSTTIGYAPDTGRLDNITSPAGSTDLKWYPGTSILHRSITTSGASVVRRETRTVDPVGRIKGVHTSAGSGAQAQTLATVGYTIDDLGRRTDARREDGSTWSYGYNNRSEVTSGHKKLSGMPGQELAAGLSFDYGYDDIGNREFARSGGDSTGQNQRQTTYTADNLNQYTAIAHPRSLDVLVRAPEAVTVTSPGNTVNTSKQGAWNRAEITSPSDGAQWLEVDASAGGQNLAVDQHLWLPPAGTAPQYDPDGNLSSDGRWTYTWDAENRLVAMQRAASVGPNLRLEFRYDPTGRRLARRIIDLANNSAILSDLRFAYDGWNLIAEFNASGQTLTPIRTHTWGIDLSNTLQGAGGVGGLLSSNQISQSPISNVPYYPSFDGNGNISAWSDAAGTVRRRIDYDPYGNVTTVETASPPMPELPFGFSTKYNDSETGLLYYGYRFYDPVTGRWPSRDPIGEKGGFNLYGFVNNRSTFLIDVKGLAVFIVEGRTTKLAHSNASNFQNKKSRDEYFRRVFKLFDKYITELNEMSDISFDRIKNRGKVGIGGDVWKKGGRADFIKLIEREKTSKWEEQIDGDIDDLIEKGLANNALATEDYDSSIVGIEGLRGLDKVTYLGDTPNRDEFIKKLTDALGNDNVVSCYRDGENGELLSIDSNSGLGDVRDEDIIPGAVAPGIDGSEKSDVDKASAAHAKFCIYFFPLTTKTSKVK